MGLEQLEREAYQIVKIKPENILFPLHIHTDYVLIARVPVLYAEIPAHEH